MSDDSPSTELAPRWYAPTVNKFLAFVLLGQGILFLSVHYRLFWFNKQKGSTVLITFAATALLLLLLMGWIFGSRLAGRKMRFSLATLLWMIPVMAIPCGWLARELDLARQQREAVAQLVASGNVIQLSHDRSYEKLGPSVLQPHVPQFLYSTFGVDFVADVTVLYLRRAEDSDLEIVKRFPKLDMLGLLDAKITDAGLENLKGLTHLNVLDIHSFDVSQISDAGLEHLKDLGQLQSLSFYKTNITDRGLEQLARFARLTNLFIEESPEVTDAGIEKLRGLPHLHNLRLGNAAVTNVGLDYIKEFPDLISLSLDGTMVTDAGFVELKGLTQLKTLELRNTALSDVGLERLQGCAQLRRLSIAGTRVTDDGVQKLKDALPGCAIER
jgi:hypothetical protein